MRCWLKESPGHTGSLPFYKCLRVSMEDVVELSTRMRRLSPGFWCLRIVEHCHAEGGQDLAPPDYHLFGPMTECLRSKHGSDKSDKVVQKTEFYEPEIHVLVCGGSLLLIETVTVLRSWDVIHRRPASFWCMIHAPVSVIIPVLKKNASPFYSSLFESGFWLVIKWFIFLRIRRK